MAPSIHQPSRPTWQCTACGEPWPCPRRKVEFGAEFASRLDLALHLFGWLAAAIDDHPDRSGELVSRYIHDLRSIRLAGRD